MKSIKELFASFKKKEAEIAEDDLFAEVLEKHFGGVKDQQTLQLLSATD